MPTRDDGAKKYDEVLAYMESTLAEFLRQVPLPRVVAHRDSFVYRFVERLPIQAVVQKLARTISGLYSARLLCEYGLFQEQATIQRVLDEIHEDIAFLCLAIIDDNLTDRHEQYLSDFFTEEFDPVNVEVSPSKRGMIRREKVRAYIANHESAATDPSSTVRLHATISKTYSGFVHAASPHIMDMYDGKRFLVRGMTGTARESEYRDDLWNYFYRGILSFGLVAKAFGDAELYKSIRAYQVAFELVSGENYSK